MDPGADVTFMASTNPSFFRTRFIAGDGECSAYHDVSPSRCWSLSRPEGVKHVSAHIRLKYVGCMDSKPANGCLN